MSLLSNADLAECRALQELAMLDTCTITRPDPDAAPVYDPATDDVTQPLLTIYTGKCRAQGHPLRDDRAETAGQYVTVLNYDVAVPWDVTDVQPGDSLTITTSSDPRLPSTPLSVLNVQASTFATARRLGCTDQH